MYKHNDKTDSDDDHLDMDGIHHDDNEDLVGHSLRYWPHHGNPGWGQGASKGDIVIMVTLDGDKGQALYQALAIMVTLDGDRGQVLVCWPSW